MRPLLLCLLLCGCVVHPPMVHQHQASYSSSGQDSGIISESKDHGGFVVNSDWVAGYDSLLSRYGEKLTPPRKVGDRLGVVWQTKNYWVSDAAMERFMVMNAMRLNP